MQRHVRYFLLVTLFFVRPALAIEFTEFFTGNLNFPTLADQADTSVHAVPGASWGAGMSLGFPIHQKLFVELGLVYTSRNFSQKNASTPPYEYALTWFQLPIVARFWFAKKLSIAGGIYLSQAVGNVNFTQNGQKTVLGYDQNHWSKNDTGVTVSLRYRTPINDLLFFVADERINWGFSQMGLSGEKSFRNYEFQSWAGVSVNL